jgi:uncharacterized membrane protein YedE/YeeE
MSLLTIPSDWLFGLAGGLVIGLSAAILLLGNARILGASGIFGSVVEGSEPDAANERLWFLGALISAPAIAALTFGAPQTHVSGNLPLLVVAGLLVGIGTRLANGCTSGHGVSGMSRFSARSIVSTLVYLGFGFIVMFAARHILGVL